MHSETDVKHTHTHTRIHSHSRTQSYALDGMSQTTHGASCVLKQLFTVLHPAGQIQMRCPLCVCVCVHMIICAYVNVNVSEHMFEGKKAAMFESYIGKKGIAYVMFV